ncbi:MAG TPA: DUF5916 domain-containing protein, partial [Longimicrobiaceae bacterium]|nr:DUF5916 domain-containing protein [Longimicrobiaceae bacterium]
MRSRRTEAAFVEQATIRLDGRFDEESWRTAPLITGFIQRAPEPGAAATEETEVRILYDTEAIYFAFRLRDSRPYSLTAPLARRDVGFAGSDWATIFIDSYHDRRTAFIFSVNPRGVKRDVLVYGDSDEDYSWDAVWAVATRADSLGWTAEFRIPFSQLRFDPEQTTWGLNLGRYVARKDEQSYWSPWLPSAAGYVSSFGVLSALSHLPAPRRLEIQPYAVGRLMRAPGDPADPFYRANLLGLAMGGDLKMGLTPSLTLTATINPDFGQVEADPSVVNLTAFETFFPERRP